MGERKQQTVLYLYASLTHFLLSLYYSSPFGLSHILLTLTHTPISYPTPARLLALI